MSKMELKEQLECESGAEFSFGRMVMSILIFMIIMCCTVAVNTELANTEPIPPMGSTRSVSREPLFITLLSTDQPIILLCVCFCFYFSYLYLYILLIINIELTASGTITSTVAKPN